MFDPKKYDNEEQPTTNKSKLDELIEQRFMIINFIRANAPVICKECEDLEKTKAKYPSDSDTVRAFEKKIRGWSKILVGLEILEKMYL